jgi:hypothetical protein
MPSNARRVCSGLARRRQGLLAFFLLLAVPRPSQAQATAAPPPVHADAPSPYPPALYDSAPSSQTAVAAPVSRAPTREPPPYSYGAVLATTAVRETNSTSVVFSPLLEGAYAIDPAFVVDLAWGLAWMVDGQGLGESTVRVGNPMLSGHFRKQLGPWRVRAGLGITFPLASLPLGMNGRLYAFVFNQNTAMWGMWNEWLWVPDRMAEPATVRADYAFASGYVVAAEIAVAQIIGVRNRVGGSDVLGQGAVEARLPIGANIVLCPRLQTVRLPASSIDRQQSAVALRGILATPYGSYFAGVLVNLDEPLGVVGGLGRWGLHLGKEIDP